MTKKMSPRQQEIFDKIVPMIADCGPTPSDVKMDANFSYDLGLDSVDQVQLVMEIERDLHVIIPEETQENIQTVGDLVKAIEKHSTNIKDSKIADNDSYEKDFEELFGETKIQSDDPRIQNLEELHRLCVAKYNEQALKKEEKTDRKPLISGQRTGILFMLAGLTVAAVGVINYKKSEKTQRVNKQVEAFEKNSAGGVFGIQTGGRTLSR